MKAEYKAVFVSHTLFTLFLATCHSYFAKFKVDDKATP